MTAPAKFNTVLGYASGDVPVYSSDYESVDETLLPNKHAYRSYVDGVFMGYKWQCVEFARRWLYLKKGFIFDNVAMAYDIFMLRSVRHITNNEMLALHSFRNGSRRHPEPGCMLIWDEGGEYEETGHVAIVSEVFSDRIRIVEQNLDHRVWPDGQNYSRELQAKVDVNGGYWIKCSFDDVLILGWVTQTEDSLHSEAIADIDPRLLNLEVRKVTKTDSDDEAWLDVDKPDEAAYTLMMGGHRLSNNPLAQRDYLCISESAIREIKHATNELHAMFMQATHQVLQDDSLLAKFNFPSSIWPRLRHSWNNRRNQMITGRMDFSVSEHGVKLYEYNADSASCYMECGKVQGKWADHFGCGKGRNPGAHLHEYLVHAWKKSGVTGLLHIMQDNDLEESYHALYMQKAIQEAGIRCKVLKGLSGVHWDNESCVVDSDGERITQVWKTWAWETALDQLRDQCDEVLELGHQPMSEGIKAPRLVDVLLRKDVRVFEPLWTLIASNKAILPILWEMYPNHPYLLNTQFNLTDDLKNKAYVIKPIVGRCGANIAIVDRHHSITSETAGQFEAQDQVYQAFFELPKIDNYNVQVSAFSVDGRFSGAGVRVDESLILTSGSDLLALRVLPDASMKVCKHNK